MEQSKSVEQQLVELLTKRNLVITTAESCTGGLLAASVINVPGASSVIKEGYITYSNESKIRILGVNEQTIKEHTVVSEEVAKEMAKGGAKAAGCDICISVTGVAGPDIEEGNPVGLVYIGCSYGELVDVKELHLEGSRQEIRNQAVSHALGWILYKLTEIWI